MSEPASTIEERLKRALIPPAWELARITRREKRKGEPGLRLLPFLVDPARAALDVGANRGIWAGEMVQLTGRVFAFEPNPKLFRFLSAALGARLDCQPLAASDSDGEAALMVPGEGRRFSNQGASLSRTKIGERPHIEVTVQTRRLDSLDLPPVGFMKIDVEGHERAVLDGARALIERDRPVMIIEIEERHTGRDIEGELNAVEALGYRTLPIRQGRLISRDRFDADADHRGQENTPCYVNNFLFLPA
ncbi:MAG: FkbM family methyltransferase [Pseudomonadota bacterium]